MDRRNRPNCLVFIRCFRNSIDIIALGTPEIFPYVSFINMINFITMFEFKIKHWFAPPLHMMKGLITAQDNN